MRYRIFFVLTLVVCLVSCGKKHVSQPTELPVVRIDTARSFGISSQQQFPGRVVPAAEVNASFKVAGTLKRVYVHEGSSVRAGQLLAELDPTDYEVQLRATEAEYAQVKAEAGRVMGLYEENGTTASNYDKARYGLQQIEAKLQHHKNQLAYTRIYAPFSGSVQKCYFEGGETVAAGMPIVSVLSAGRLEVEVSLPATSYLHRDEFASYSCTLDVLPGECLRLAPVSFFPKANANQLYTMRLSFVSGAERVAPGMSAWVTIETKNNADQLRIPATALVADGEQSFVFLFSPSDSIVRKMAVTVESLHTDGTAVVTGSLQEGDLVVSTGVHHLSDATKVKILAPQSKTNVGGML